MKKITMVDFFCGAGIGAVGFKEAGYDIIDAFDIKDYAVNTYNKNIGNHARLLDIRKVKDKEFKYADLFVGGFPCTPFSVAGKGEGALDEKNGDLGYHFLRAVKAAKPKAFIVENVKGITFKKHIDFFNDLLKDFTDAGYDVYWELTDCNEYGVPQIRERVFVIGIRKDLKKEFKFPDKLEEDLRPNLKDAIYDLKDKLGENNIANHEFYYNDGYSSRFTSRNRQRQWNQPSFTIVASARQLPLYPEPANFDIRYENDLKLMPRRFTVRECLRIQTVPDTFIFDDSIPLLKQYERCSGIPSLIAFKLGEAIKRSLTSCDHQKKIWLSDIESGGSVKRLYECYECREEIEIKIKEDGFFESNI